MNLKTIENEQEHDASLEEIERLFSCEPGSDDEVRLEFLITQVEAYGAVHYPISLPTAEAMAEYEAEKRGQSFEEAKEATFEQYDVALQRLAHEDRDNFPRSLDPDSDPNEAAQDFNQRHEVDHMETAENG